MHVKSFVAAVSMAVVAALVLDILINAVLMRDAFEASAGHWLPAAELNRRVPIGFAALAGSMVALGAAFVRMGRYGVRAGLEFGAWLALAACAGVAGLYSLVPWPIPMIASMALQQAANNLVLGWCLGRFYRPR
jgi:hypothetical protein